MPTYMTGVPWVIHDDQTSVSFLTDNGTASGHNEFFQIQQNSNMAAMR